MAPCSQKVAVLAFRGVAGAENLMVMTVVARMVERRERVKTDDIKGKILGRKAGFRSILDLIFPSFRP